MRYTRRAAESGTRQDHPPAAEDRRAPATFVGRSSADHRPPRWAWAE